MVSDTELVTRLKEILRSSDLNTTTAGAVRRQLESDFSVDLSDRKKFISSQIDLFLNAGDPDDGNDVSPENDVAGEDEKVGEEEEEEEEEEDDVEEEEEEDDIKHDVKNGKKKRPKDVETNKKRGGGFTKLCSVSPQLQEFLGVSEIARTQVVKKVWEYIKEHDLQDPENRRNIKCDEKLHSIFRVDKINMFQMNKALSKHIWPLEADEESGASNSIPSEKKQKRQKEEETASNSIPPEKKQKRQKEEDTGKSKREEKQKKGGGTTGFLQPLQLSDALVNFFGTGETTLSRADTVKKIWNYIKQNNLQDPSDKRTILCDEKLKELFDVESFHGFSVAKLLTAHLTKIEQ